MDVLKGGIVVEALPLRGKSFFTIGRLPTCVPRLRP
jgi:hypothetical protein